MNDKKTVWGGAAGKIIASLIVLAIICGSVSAALAYATYGESLLSKDEITLISSVSNENGTVTMELKVNKPGYFLSSYKTKEVGDKLFVKLYSSVREGSNKSDKTGVYTIDLTIGKDIGSVVQEGPGSDEYTLFKVKTKS